MFDTFFRKLCRVRDNVETKVEPIAIDDNMEHAHYMLDT